MGGWRADSAAEPPTRNHGHCDQTPALLPNAVLTDFVLSRHCERALRSSFRQVRAGTQARKQRKQCHTFSRGGDTLRRSGSGTACRLTASVIRKLQPRTKNLLRSTPAPRTSFDSSPRPSPRTGSQRTSVRSILAAERSEPTDVGCNSSGGPRAHAFGESAPRSRRSGSAGWAPPQVRLPAALSSRSADLLRGHAPHLVYCREPNRSATVRPA